MAAEEIEDITLVLRPSATGGVEVRITPGYDGEMEKMLTEAGIYQGRKLELSAEVAAAVLIAIGGAGGLKALRPVLIAWFNRHQHTKVEMYEDGTVKSVSGTSPEKAKRLIDHIKGSQAEYDRRMAQIDEEMRQRTIDPGDHRPSGPATGE